MLLGESLDYSTVLCGEVIQFVLEVARRSQKLAANNALLSSA